MGYTTDFDGEFTLNKKLDQETHEFLNKFNATRRMGWKNLPEVYGEEGEFFVDAKGDYGQDHGNPNIIDYNTPPKTQPGLWCGWVPNEDGTAIIHDGCEKFYNYISWIKYLIEKILQPKGYYLSGEMTYQGEDSDDFGKIVITNNVVLDRVGKKTYQGE